MVKVVRASLHKVLGKSKLSYEEPETVLIQMESIVNSPPLTFMTMEEVCEPLTLSHLIYGKWLILAINKEYIDDTTIDISSEQCSNRVKYIQKLYIIIRVDSERNIYRNCPNNNGTINKSLKQMKVCS